MLSLLLPTLRRLCINLETNVQLKKCISLTSGTQFAKKELPFVYERPVKELQVFNSGDTKELMPLDPTRPLLKYEGLEEELKNSSPQVQKLISLAFNSRNEATKIYISDLVKSVQRHIIDSSSYESKIARLTVIIRRHQDFLRNISLTNSNVKVSLKEAIDKRNKTLRFLRMKDYKRYEWIIEKLGLTHGYAPMFTHWKTRKGTMRVMTREYCNKLRKNKIDAYKAKLKLMQKDFLREKEEALEWIKKEKEELGIKDEVIEKGK